MQDYYSQTELYFIKIGNFVLKNIYQIFASIFNPQLQTMFCINLLVIFCGTVAIFAIKKPLVEKWSMLVHFVL